jgi:hypothetical protein
MEKIIKKKGSSFGFIFYFIIKLYSNINKKKYINVYLYEIEESKKVRYLIMYRYDGYVRLRRNYCNLLERQCCLGSKCEL